MLNASGLARALLNAGLVLAAAWALTSLVVGRVAASVIVLAVLWLARTLFAHRGQPARILAGHETSILLAGLLVVYLANGHTLGGGDTVGARYLPLSLLREARFHLDRFPFLYETCVPYFLALVNGHYLSAYPVAGALLALPLYVPAALFGVPGDSPVVGQLEKLAAASIVALSAIALYRGARLIATRRMALVIAAAYALGSSSLSASSQALWQHGPSQLGLAGALYCLLRGRREPAWIVGAGLPLAFAVIARPTDVLIAAPVAVYILLEHPRRFWGFLLAGLPPALFQLWYNATYFGDPLRTQFPLSDGSLWSTPFWTGLAGITLSPGRGLFVYSPIFVLSVVGALLAWRRGGDPLLRALGVGTALVLVLYAKWHMWWGGFSFGPRILADLTPVLALCLAPLGPWIERSRALRVATLVLLACSIAAHAIGAFVHDAYWNTYAAVDHFPGRLWSWSDNQLVNPTRLVLGRAAIVLSRVPTSRNEGQPLSASYRLSLPAGSTVAAGAPLDVSLAIANDGPMVWLAWPRSGAGVVRLAWGWYRPSETAPVAAEALPLYHDVRPGGSHSFRLMMYAPLGPGSYVLEVGLLRHAGRCTSSFTSANARQSVTVVAPPRLLDRPPSGKRAPCVAGPYGLPVNPPCAGSAREIPMASESLLGGTRGPIEPMRGAGPGGHGPRACG